MERGKGVKVAEKLDVHPSTVSRNKERLDVVNAVNEVTHIENVQTNLINLNKQ